MRILVVEDEPLLAMTLEASLLDAGHQVVGTAATASRALEIAEKATPELALVDINLRDGSSGIDVARELLRRWGAPSLFVSGQSRAAHANQDAALGYIDKPYTPETVVASIEVAKVVLGGGHLAPPEVPRGLELFEKPQ